MRYKSTALILGSYLPHRIRNRMANFLRARRSHAIDDGTQSFGLPNPEGDLAGRKMEKKGTSNDQIAVIIAFHAC